MKKYCTEYIKNGKLFAGKVVEADSFEEAEARAKELGLEVCGEQVMEIDFEDRLN